MFKVQEDILSRGDMLSDYQIYLERPIIKRVKRLRKFLQLLLMAINAFIVYKLLNTDDIGISVGNILLASGLLPFLLSLPLLTARFIATETTAFGILFRDWEHSLAFIFNIGFITGGSYLLLFNNEDGVETYRASLSEIFTEVAVITLLTVVFHVPAVEDDETEELLPEDEVVQLERSGVLTAEWVGPVNTLLGAQYEKDLEWYYPAGMKQSRDSESPGNLDSATVQNYLINDVSPEWSSPWFITALGRCDVSELGQEIIERLNTFLSGSSFPRDRFLTQSAILALGNLYFGTGNPKVSKRIFDLFLIHEISDLRATCLLALRAINQTEFVAFVECITDLDKLTRENISVFHSFYQTHFIDSSLLDKTRSLNDVLPYLRSPAHDIRLLGLVTTCLVLAESPQENEAVEEYLETVKREILEDFQESHVNNAIALHSLSGIVESLTDSRKVWGISLEMFRTNVFKSVRNAASEVLTRSSFPHLSYYKCFGDSSTRIFETKGFSKSVFREIVERQLGKELVKKIEAKMKSFSKFENDVGQLFAEYEREPSFDPLADPALLLFVNLASRKHKVSDVFIQARLNSPDRFVRYVALACVGAFNSKKLVKQAVPAIASHELISDVRDLAKVLLIPLKELWVLTICDAGEDEVEKSVRDEALIRKETEALYTRLDHK